MPEQQVLLGIEAGIAALFQSGRSALRDYSRLFHPELQPTGFTILRMIFACDPAQAGTVIQQTGLDKSAVSRQIKVLRDLGLIETRRDPHDGRSSFLVPTPLAEQRMEALKQRMKRDYRDRLAGWTNDDLIAFSTLLERFNSSDPAA
ncbi:MarR family winged helix-turn-helix transcriptional regulator [Agreia sp. COWG]|uniref:MarR family winged helix-turn-helix transcriptional regulator n=1 Tax=Agreia sp. COWG TaxID=2773266 RepID=UPI001925D0A7|nr:MarR family winged helix-turn-helix transcriptional regulator [Agreia sp. COWG]